MSEDELNPVSRRVTCPTCKGAGEALASGIQYAPGHSGPYSQMSQCPDCYGKGLVEMLFITRKSIGAEIRRWRRSNGLTLRQAADRAGLSPADISAMECGRVENSGWGVTLKASEDNSKCPSCGGITESEFGRCDDCVVLPGESES